MPTVILRNIGQRSQLQYCEIFCKEASYNMVEASSISLPSHLTAATIICTRNFANFCKFVKLTKCGLAGMEVKFQQFCIVSFQSSDTFLLAFRSWALSDSAQFISFQKEDMSWTRHSSDKSIKQTCGILGFDFGFLAQPSNHPQTTPKPCICFTGPLQPIFLHCSLSKSGSAQPHPNTSTQIQIGNWTNQIVESGSNATTRFYSIPKNQPSSHH